jgi:hypothetical protein
MEIVLAVVFYLTIWIMVIWSANYFNKNVT